MKKKRATRKKVAKEPSFRDHRGAGVALGICLGVALGISMKNLAIGIAVGVALGIAIEDTWRKNR